MKLSFNIKLHSLIIYYGLHFELFQYDGWLFKTVSGAINTTQLLKCSPTHYLDMKSFSPTFWQWQHRFVIDAVDQYGLPDVFITLSCPYEWSFLFPLWIERIRQQTGKGPTKLAGHKTSHIVNVSIQIVRGYLCRSNSQKWSNHVFNYSGNAKQKISRPFFYRCEFQKRGTIHLHLLVWLRLLHMMNVRFSLLNMVHRILGVTLPNF